MRVRFSCWILMALSLVLGLAGCGGGGGGGASGSGSGGDFSLDTTSVEMRTKQLGSYPDVVRIRMTLQDDETAFVGAGFRDAPQPDWLGVFIDGGPTIFDIVVGPTTTDLSPGRYTTVMTIGTADDEGNVLKTRDVEIAYVIEAGLVIQTAPFTASTIAGTGQPIPGSAVSVIGAGISYQASSSASWMIVPGGTRNASDSLPVSFNATGLVPGTYTATLTVTNNADPSDTASLVVTLQAASPAMTVTSTNVSGETTYGSSVTTAQAGVSVAGDPTQFIVTTTTPWIAVPSSVVTGPGSFTLHLTALGLDVGTHTGSVRLTNLANPNLVIDVPVTLVVRLPQIGLLTSVPTFGGTTGRDLSARPVGFSIDTGTNSYPWTLSVQSADGWLETDTTSGTMNQAGAGATLDADRRHLVRGSYSGQFTVSAVVNGKTISLTTPVALTMAGNHLEVSERGVAFSDFPSRKTLSRSLTVRSTYGFTDVPWEASADQTWLTVTAAGNTGGALQLQADPTGLAAGMTHYANVTVTSPDDAVQNTQVVRVGLWVGLTDPQTVTINGQLPLAAFSPVAPIAYGIDYGSSIKAYDLYTGELVREYPGIGQVLVNLVLSPDGRTAFVDDTETNVVKAVDLESGSVLYTIPYAFSVQYYSSFLTTLRVRAQEFLMILVDDSTSVYDMQTGQPVTLSTPVYYGTPSPDGLDAYHPETQYLLRRIKVDYTDVPGGGGLSYTPTVQVYQSQSRQQGTAVSLDGQYVYVSGGIGFPLLGRDLSPQGSTPDACCTRMPRVLRNGLWSGVVEFTHSGLPASDLYFFTADGEVVDAFDTVIGELHLQGISSDATRVVTVKVSFGIAETQIRNTPPPPP